MGEDVWFHVDKVSSAHVYLRLAPGQSLADLSKDVITDCAQLVKANSIQGNKMNDVDVGQIGFHSNKAVKKVRLASKDNAIVNRLNKTKVEKEVDFRAEREGRDKRERDDKKKQYRKEEDAKKAEEKARKEAAELKSYDRLMTDDNMTSNKDGGNDSDDFM